MIDNIIELLITEMEKIEAEEDDDYHNGEIDGLLIAIRSIKEIAITMTDKK